MIYELSLFLDNKPSFVEFSDVYFETLVLALVRIHDCYFSSTNMEDVYGVSFEVLEEMTDSNELSEEVSRSFKVLDNLLEHLWLKMTQSIISQDNSRGFFKKFLYEDLMIAKITSGHFNKFMGIIVDKIKSLINTQELRIPDYHAILSYCTLKRIHESDTVGKKKTMMRCKKLNRNIVQYSAQPKGAHELLVVTKDNKLKYKRFDFCKRYHLVDVQNMCCSCKSYITMRSCEHVTDMNNRSCCMSLVKSLCDQKLYNVPVPMKNMLDIVYSPMIDYTI